MKKNFWMLVSATVLLLSAVSGIANALIVDATITADNYYALYYGDAEGLTFVGRNELGRNGDFGQYNWSVPENWNFEMTAGQSIYIAGWSDKSVTQALIGEFVFGDSRTYLTNAQDWSVFLTGNEPNYGDNLERPSNSLVQSDIARAEWAPIYEVRPNGSSPWGPIAGIDSQAQWIWGSEMEAPGTGEYQLFKLDSDVTPVPEPASIFLLGIGLVGLAGRMRKRLI